MISLNMIHPDKLFGQLGNRMFQMAHIYAQARRGDIPDIYLQDPKYFEDCKDQIKALYGQGIGKEINQVAIHVRRGDYVGNKFYVDLMQTSYYEDAMALFPKKEFLIFSDDIEWCKQQAIFSACEFSTGNDTLQDLNRMAECNGHIIANSSYSWWAAFVSPYTQKVVAPTKERWYSDGVERTKCPKEWIRI